MRKIVPFAFAAAALIPLAAAASPNGGVQSERELRRECSYEITGVRECLEKKQEASQADLKRAEDEVLDALSHWDEDRKYVNQAKARLAASSTEFAKYRTSQCAFASALGGGAIGNALDMRRLACATELNGRRAEQLRDAVSNLPKK